MIIIVWSIQTYCQGDSGGRISRTMLFEFPILEHFWPHIIQIAQIGLILPRWGLILPRKPPPSPVLYSAVTKPLLRYTKHLQPHPKTPLFLAWTWKWAKSTTIWAIWTSTGQNVWKVGKTFLEVGKKKNVHRTMVFNNIFLVYISRVEAIVPCSFIKPQLFRNIIPGHIKMSFCYTRCYDFMILISCIWPMISQVLRCYVWYHA